MIAQHIECESSKAENARDGGGNGWPQIVFVFIIATWISVEIDLRCPEETPEITTYSAATSAAAATASWKAFALAANSSLVKGRRRLTETSDAAKQAPDELEPGGAKVSPGHEFLLLAPPRQ